MALSLTIAAAQLNPHVGDIEGNAKQIMESYHQLCKNGADVIIAPELALCGYPPEDLVLRPFFQEKSMNFCETIAHQTGEQALIFGSLYTKDDQCYNAAIVAYDSKIQHIIYKSHLPNYGVFDEERVFTTHAYQKPFTYKSNRLSVLICEDAWQENAIKAQAKHKPDVFITIHASPFELDKPKKRYDIAKHASKTYSKPFIYVNQVGGQDELVFDGRSFAYNAKGTLSSQCKAWMTDNAILELEDSLETPHYDIHQESYEALTLGLQDYVQKNHFRGVVLGFSGGIDSALSAAIAVDALGKDHVHLVMMPSAYTSQESLDDAEESAKLLGCRLDHIAISDMVTSYNGALAPMFSGTTADTTEENIQSRIRGNLLMALSNKFGYMVLTTGNKSEMAVGYATLYGDMCGGYNVLKDIYKTQVYALSRWRNTISPVISDNIFLKAPTAELRPNQTDQDNLPSYETLDGILERLIEQRQSVASIVADGFDENTVKKVAKLLLRAEYKRRQAPPGVKISGLSFGKDRRYPITNAYLFS